MKTPDVKRECNITINGKTVEGEKFSNIPMNSPECIKEKLNGYSARYLSGNNWGREILGTGEIMHNAFFYIQQLESDNESKQKRIDELEFRLAQVERARDACIDDMKQFQGATCNTCKHHYRPDPNVRHYECALFGKFSDFLNSEEIPLMCGKFEWRGVCEENTKEET